MDRGRRSDVETSEGTARVSQERPSDEVEAGSDPAGAEQVLQGGLLVRHREVQVPHLRNPTLPQRQERFASNFLPLFK